MKTIILALALACTAATKPTGLVEEGLVGSTDSDYCCVLGTWRAGRCRM